MSRNKSRLLFGTLLQILGVALITIGVICFCIILFGVLPSEGLPLMWVLLIVAGITLLPLGAVCYRAGKKGTVVSADVIMSRDNRAPVLYLRSFEFDKFTANPTGAATQVTELLNLWESRLYKFSPYQLLGTIKLQTAEEILSAALSKVGPCIAVDDPNLDKPVLGFSRLKLPHDEWQSEVESLMQASGLVVLCAGSTPGLMWELERVAKNVARERLLILIAPSTPEEWWGRAEKIFDQRLPKFISPVDRSFCGIIYFDQDGKAHDRLLFTVNGQSTRNALEEALDPVFAQLQVSPCSNRILWISSPKNIFKLFIMLMLSPLLLVPLAFIIIFIWAAIYYEIRYWFG